MWHSVPRFDETLRINLSVPGATTAHLLFLFSHCSSKASKTQVFGFSFLPLSSASAKDPTGSGGARGYGNHQGTSRTASSLPGGETILADGIRTISTYVPSSGMSSMGSQGGKRGKGEVLHPMDTYLAGARARHPSVARKDMFRVSTRLCSSTSTQSQALSDLTHCAAAEAGSTTAQRGVQESDEIDAGVAKVLERLTYMDSTEVALHLRAIFDRLFTLLAGTTFVNTQRAVFDVIVHCVELLAGKRGNPSHREALNIYINDVFDTQNDELYKIIIDQATEMMRWLDTVSAGAPLDASGAKKRRTLTNMMRCFQYVVKFATTAGLRTTSRCADAAAREEMETTFKHSMEQLMYYADNLMLKEEPKWVRLVQDLAIQNFTPVFEELEKLFNQAELGEIARGFIESVPHDESQRASLRMQKLLMVHSMMQSSAGIFTRTASRKACIAAVVRMLQSFLLSQQSGERMLTVLILKELVQITHNAGSQDDAWNLACMLPEIAQCVSTILEEKHVHHQNARSEMASAVNATVANVQEAQSAGGNGGGGGRQRGFLGLGRKKQKAAHAQRRVSNVGTPSIAHVGGAGGGGGGGGGRGGARRLRHKMSVASRLASATGLRGHEDGQQQQQQQQQSASQFPVAVPEHLREEGVWHVLQHAVVSLFEVVRMMSPEQKAYFLSTITATHRDRFTFFANLLHICHRMLALRDEHRVFPFMWLVMCIGEHQAQLSILAWFADMAADEFLFDRRGVEAAQAAQAGAGGEAVTAVDDGDIEAADEKLRMKRQLSAELDGMDQIDGEETVSQLERLTLWDGYMWLGVTLLNARNLKLEQMTPQKREFVETNFGDARDDVVDVLEALWDKLGTRKLAVIDQLVLPLLRLTDSGHERSREFGSFTYFDMLRTEHRETEALSRVENATIDAVTSIVAERNVAASHGKGFLQLFSTQLEAKFLGDDILSSPLAMKFLESTKQLFELLSTLSRYDEKSKGVGSEVFEDEKTASMLTLMAYLQETARHEMFSKYLHRLRDLQLSLGNYNEAGNTLMLAIDGIDLAFVHANQGSGGSGGGGSSKGVVPVRKKASLKDLQASTLLSAEAISLIHTAAAYFKQGGDWKRALRLLERLRTHYEKHAFDFHALADVLQLQAKLYLGLSTTEVYPCTHFRVAFYGTAWDKKNQNKVFIYRGAPLESIMEFIARIKRKGQPASRVKMVPAGKQTPGMAQEDKCYLQVSSVKPAYSEAWDACGEGGGGVPAMDRAFPDHVPKCVRDYQLSFGVNTFTFNKTFRKAKKKSKNEFMDVWSRTNVVRTEIAFPGTMRRTAIVGSRAYVRNPLEVACQVRFFFWSVVRVCPQTSFIVLAKHSPSLLCTPSLQITDGTRQERRADAHDLRGGQAHRAGGDAVVHDGHQRDGGRGRERRHRELRPVPDGVVRRRPPRNPRGSGGAPGEETPAGGAGAAGGRTSGGAQARGAGARAGVQRADAAPARDYYQEVPCAAGEREEARGAGAELGRGRQRYVKGGRRHKVHTAVVYRIFDNDDEFYFL